MFKKTIYKGGIKAQEFHSENLKASYGRVTTRLAQESEHYFGESGFPVFFIARIFQTPFSDIVQCVVELNNISFGIYVKFSLVNKNVEGEHDRILKNTTREVEVANIFSEYFSNEQAVSVPEVIAFFPDEMAIVTKEKDGVPLMRLIVGSAKGRPGTGKLDLLKHACYSVGNALKVFQKMPLIKTGKIELPSNLVSYVDLRLKLLLETGSLAMRDYRNVLNFLEQQLGEIEEEALDFCSVHGDLALGNILISSDQVIFLDLGMYRQGPPSFDPAYFYQHLDDLNTNPLFLSSTIVQLQDVFFEGYSENSIRESPLFLSYYVRNIVNQLLDLSRRSHLHPIKRIYQKWQYQQYLFSLKKVIQAN